MEKKMTIKLCDVCYEDDEDTDEEATEVCSLCKKDICEAHTNDFFSTNDSTMYICDDCSQKLNQISKKNTKIIIEKIKELLKPYLALAEL